MQRIKKDSLDKIETYVPLAELNVLEVGCGNGNQSIDLAKRCARLTGIDPDGKRVKDAIARNIPNATFMVGVGEKLPFNDHAFDIVIYIASFHHVPIPNMKMAIDEAIRVVLPNGYIIFQEPGEVGSFFEAALLFDGDERDKKKAAYQAMLNHKRLAPIAEIADETAFQFDSTNDYLTTMEPTMNLDSLDDFLKNHNFMLDADRRINIYQPK